MHGMNLSMSSNAYRSTGSYLNRCRVTILTLAVALLSTSCSYIEQRTLDQCKNHAYVETVLEDYITTRYHSNAPVRMAIIPFTVPANLTGDAYRYAGLGNELAYRLHADFLNKGIVPIVEVLDRQDWPRKKDEFYTGNFGAIAQAREAGYDLVLVGVIEEFNGIYQAVSSTKIIEVESGTTLWYGKTIATTERRDFMRGLDYVGIQDRKPANDFSDELIEKLIRCISKEIYRTDRQG